MSKRIIGILIGIVLTIGAPAAGFAASRYEILQIGDRDGQNEDWVYELQQELYDLGYLEVHPTGYFGTDTQNAVVAFQEATDGLSADGKAGPLTRKELFGSAYIPIDSGRQLPENEISADLPKDGSADSSDPAAQTDGSVDFLSPGDKGESISDLQERLRELEYYDYSQITGYYGPITTQAVEKFQRTHNLTVTGVMTSEDLRVLAGSEAKYYTMYPEDSGEDIYAMQERLAELGYFDASPTGYFGSITSDAVMRFQDANNLTVDGMVGKNTRNVLYSENAVVNRSSQSEEGKTAAPREQSSDIERMIEIGNKQIGKPYAYGSAGPNSYDCSGFVYYCLKNAGISASRLSSAGYSKVSQWQTITDVNLLQPGDLVYFRSDSSETVSHIGIYLGGGSMLHSAPAQGGVATSSISSGYYARNFLGAKRIPQ